MLRKKGRETGSPGKQTIYRTMPMVGDSKEPDTGAPDHNQVVPSLKTKKISMLQTQKAPK